VGGTKESVTERKKAKRENPVWEKLRDREREGVHHHRADSSQGRLCAPRREVRNLPSGSGERKPSWKKKEGGSLKKIK